jgi:hypothetical protein
MPFTTVPLGQSCILLRFSPLEPLLHQVDPRYSHTLPSCSQTRNTQSSLISKQVVPYQTCGDTCYPRDRLLRTDP